MMNTATHLPLKTRFAEYFRMGFGLILRLQHTKNLGEPTVLRQKIKALLSKIEQVCNDVNYPEKQVKKGIFALVAFIDEAILTSQWPGKIIWQENPLQVEFYENYNAGETFFENLAEIRNRARAEVELLEIYYYCLALGFKGKYAFMEAEQHQVLLGDIHEEITRVLIDSAMVLSPNGLPSGKRNTKPPIQPGEIPVWVYYSAILGLGLMFYLGLSISNQLHIEAFIEQFQLIYQSVLGIT